MWCVCPDTDWQPVCPSVYSCWDGKKKMDGWVKGWDEDPAPARVGSERTEDITNNVSGPVRVLMEHLRQRVYHDLNVCTANELEHYLRIHE